MTLPKKFYKRMQTLLPQKDFDAFIESYNRPAYKGIRINTLKDPQQKCISHLPIQTYPVPWCPTGYTIDGDIRPGKNPYYYTGVYYVQEPSAMAAAEALSANPGDWVLDLCAAPGGKSAQLSCQLEGKGVLVSNELIKSRVPVLASNLERMGSANGIILNAFPQALADRMPEIFDKILVDAPCSGEGMFRKDPTILKQWSQEAVMRFAGRQRAILDSAYALLKPGGTLVYATCTFSPEENEGTVNHFLKKYPDIHLLPLSLKGVDLTGFPEAVTPANPELAKTQRLMPHNIPGEGHFIALMQKEGSPSGSPKLNKKKGVMTKITKTELRQLSDFEKDFLTEPLGRNLYKWKDELYQLPQGLEPTWFAGLPVYQMGLHLGTFKPGRFEPSHGFAMHRPAEGFRYQHAISEDDEAYAYLKGHTLPDQANKGWTAVHYRGYNLGFGKVSGGILKNHYPKGLRIFKNI
ncbi:MAG: NOL1/NOP2/sun family putative RNA methylase [Eubacteriaceae bacterium]|jgi:NOL1/NOP2/sun family putative RNA methylase|nr:NOL1/NOP2/sun family putative RNA methylase [Eubacteriaceae bacterium]